MELNPSWVIRKLCNIRHFISFSSSQHSHLQNDGLGKPEVKAHAHCLVIIIEHIASEYYSEKILASKS